MILTLSLLTLLLLAIFFSLPIGLTMILIGSAGIIMTSGWQVFIAQFHDITYASFAIYELSIIPLFIIMGNIAVKTGLSKNLFEGIAIFLYRVKGNLAYTTLLSASGFATLCGSSLATTSTISKIAYPYLKTHQYDDRLTLGLINAGGTLGILIPPSLILIIYAVLVEVSILKMFEAAMIPALLALLFFILTTKIIIKINPHYIPHPSTKTITRQEYKKALALIAPTAIVFMAVLGSLYSGIFTPVQAASLGVVVLICMDGIKRAVKKTDTQWWPMLRDAFLNAGQISAALFILLLGAKLLSIFIASSNIPFQIVELLERSAWPPLSILILILICLILLGCFFESLSLILLTIPFLWPIISNLDLGLTQEEMKIWFGILALIIVELGLITPPFGMNILVLKATLKKIDYQTIYRSIIPYLGAELLRIIMIIACPAITLYLPKLLSG